MVIRIHEMKNNVKFFLTEINHNIIVEKQYIYGPGADIF